MMTITRMALLALLTLGCALTSLPAAAQCPVDLRCPGQMSDIVSNALLLGLEVPEKELVAFLDGAETRYDSGQELLEASAARFEVEVAVLAAAVEEFKHCNCSHGGPEEAGETLSFARDVTLHVVLHELGHALVREFDLPVLGNEETLADAFATHYLTHHLPERAAAVLEARTRSLMIEAQEVPRAEWTVGGEHDNDARRAHQIAALAVAADAEKYAAAAANVGMSEGQIKKSKDYGAEIHRSWRRILRPLWMPEGMASTEARIRCDEEDELLRQLCAGGWLEEVASILRRFDWHSQVTIHLAAGDGGASWSRSKRTITVRSEYVRRFVEQGRVEGF